MEYHNPSEIVKDLSFGDDAVEKIAEGVNILAQAVRSTLGASGKCVIFEDALGRPVITKDGVTVAESVVLHDPVQNIGATLIKEAARKTVKEAGDGTTTATILAQAILARVYKEGPPSGATPREIKEGILKATTKVLEYLDGIKITVEGDMLTNVANISCNSDIALGTLIADAFNAVGKNGVVLLEESDSGDTFVDVVDGIQVDSGNKSPHLHTDKEKEITELEKPLVLVVASPIPNVRRIQSILEYVIKTKRSLLIVATMEQQPFATLLMNKVKGNIKVNIIDPPGFGPTKRDTMEDLAAITGATIMDEELGDDMDMISPDVLGECLLSITDDKNTVITVESIPQAATERIDIAEKKLKAETNPFIAKKLEQRLAMLSGKVAVVKVGAGSKIELKEKYDRAEDAIYATKAALKEGIVPGGGVALLNASERVSRGSVGETILLDAIAEPFKAVLQNALLQVPDAKNKKGWGVDATTGKSVNMIKAGIIDPVLVTKTALKNAVSVVNTIVSADCVISNVREV
jgi:chaperonin GroEL